MHVSEITVSAGRTINHPVENYANLKPFVTLKAVLDEGEDVDAAVKELQAKAEGLVDDHANELKRHIRDMHYLGEKQREVKRLEDQLIEGQERLAALRSEIPLMLEGDSEEFDPIVKTDEARW